MAFLKGKETEAQANTKGIEKLHTKIGQLVVERFFLAKASVGQWLFVSAGNHGLV